MSELTTLPGARTLEAGPDIDRILTLPARPSATPEDALRWSALLCPEGEGRLRLPQCETLREAYGCRGVAGPQRVGSGKTLETLLLPTVLDARRPVLVVPASLRAKTASEFAEYYRAGWRVRLPKILSYAILGRPDRADLLDEINPDLLILDEAHRASNLRAACTRRLSRFIWSKRVAESGSDYLDDPARWATTFGSQLCVAVLSGSLIGDAMLEYHHLLVWALGPFAPVPLRTTTAERWATALEQSTPLLSRALPGRLAELPGGFSEHLRTRRGVVPTPGADIDVPLIMRPWKPEIPTKVARMISEVRETSTRPDGEPLGTWDVPDVLCQLAQGFYYVWDPLPPWPWIDARRGWVSAANAILEDEENEIVDSEGQLVNLLDAWTPETHDPSSFLTPASVRMAQALLADWRAVKGTFVPNPVPVWVDDSVLRQAADTDHPTLIWTRHTAAGERLAQLGVPWYPGGSAPEDHPPSETIGLMMSAHSTGRNLQAWAHSRVLVPPAKARHWEQLLGRTHRPGQRAAAVVCEYIEAIDYHRSVMKRVRDQAEITSEKSGFTQKLSQATRERKAL